MKWLLKLLLVALTLVGYVGCKKFVEAPLPTTELVGAAVYNSNQTAAAAVTGILVTAAGNSVAGGSDGISALAGLSADEFSLYPGASPLLQQVYGNGQLSTNPSSIWADLYNIIYQANSAIDGINNATAVSAGMKLQLVGEAEFMRAFSYFYLVNLYGDVPLVLTPNYEVSEALPRASQIEVYQQIMSDLRFAQASLGSDYVTPAGAATDERTRPNAAAAAAMLARVYLYNGEYDSAEIEATLVIANNNYSLVTDLDSAFLPNNTEAIWQLEIPNDGFNTADGGLFNLGSYGGPSAYYPFMLSDSLESQFEQGDLRRLLWTDSILVGGMVYYYPYKYKLFYTGNPPGEYPTVLRLAEMFLIRAEARAEQDRLTGSDGALSDLNIVRQRAGLAISAAVSEADVLAAILHERRVELFTEYGHRWLDLRRTDNINSVMSLVTPLKGGSAWAPTDTLYPIPQNDIRADAKLTQNPGYN